MNSKAQAGLEYLMTYGWALILVVTVIGVLVFIVSTPVDDVVFRSSDPTKLMLKGASVLAGAAQIKLQNITGGKITITALTSDNYLGLKINGQDPPLEIGAGGELLLEGTGTTGTITVEYTDFAGIGRTATITGSGGDEDSTPAAFNPGSGTELDPYNIRDCDALQAVRDGDMDAYYQLTQSFSCSGIANFKPIGIGIDYAPVTPFNGHFDGQGFTISGLTINRPSENYIGLFGVTTAGSTISNLGLTGVNITGGSFYTGGLIGASEGTVTNSHSSGSVAGDWGVGVLVGYAGGSITDSYSSGTATGTYRVAGLVGDNQATVADCYFLSGTVTALGIAGGLAGLSISGSIDTSYSNGNIIGGSFVGGLVGDNMAHLYNSYSTGDVSGASNVGGLVGNNDNVVAFSYSTGSVTGTSSEVGGVAGSNDYGVIGGSFSTGSVTGDSVVGGSVGKNGATIVNNYWYTDNPLLDCYSGGNSGCPTAASEDAASDFFGSTHEIYIGAFPWDFATIWESNAGSYPTLR